MATEKEIEEFYDINILNYVGVGKEYYKQSYEGTKRKLDKIDNDGLLQLLEDLNIMRIILSCHKNIEGIKIDKQKTNIVVKINEIYNFINESLNKGEVE